jgi:hypothetical protein
MTDDPERPCLPVAFERKKRFDFTAYQAFPVSLEVFADLLPL